jgi:hypothetical protein
MPNPSTQQRCSFQLPRPPEPSRRSPTTLCAASPAHSVTPSLAALHRQSANPPIRPRPFHRPFLAPPGPAAPVAATQQPHHPRPSAISLFAPVAFRFLLSSALPLAFRLLPANIGTCLQSGPASVETPVPFRRFSTHPHTTSPVHRDGSLHTRPPCQTGKRKSSPPNERASS